MPKRTLLIVLSCILITQLTIVNSCLSFNQQNKKCLICPSGTHLYKGNCLYDIDNCTQYYQGIDCKKCLSGYRVINNFDRIQCKKLESQQKDQFFQQQINPQLQPNTTDQKQQFYNFLNDYFTQKYHQNNVQSHLVKILDKTYHNGSHNVQMYYKTSNGIEKAVSAVIGIYKTFQLRDIIPALPTQITDDQIVLFYDQKQIKKISQQQIKQDKVVMKSLQQQKQSTQSSNNNTDQIKQTSDFNFQYQKPQIRDKDIGFQTSQEFLKLSNNKILDDNAKVVGCFVKSSGLRKHYKLFYKTSTQQLYEGEVIYDIVRRRAYILNFGKQFST